MRREGWRLAANARRPREREKEREKRGEVTPSSAVMEERKYSFFDTEASEKKIGAMEATLRVAAERSGRSNARSARVVNPRRPPSASCSTSFGAGLVRHRRASMANYVITRALSNRIEADSTRAAQPEAAVHWIYQCRRPRFIRAAIEHLETRCTRASRARGHRANCVRYL